MTRIDLRIGNWFRSRKKTEPTLEELLEMAHARAEEKKKRNEPSSHPNAISSLSVKRRSKAGA